MIAKKIIITYFIIIVTWTLAAHSGNEHAIEIGHVLGLCDSSGVCDSANNKTLYMEIGEVVAELIDADAPELRKKLNYIVYNALCDEVFFSRTIQDINKKVDALKHALVENKKDLDLSRDNSDLLDKVAKHLNWVADELGAFPGYTEALDIGNEILRKRNDFNHEFDHKKEMYDFIKVKQKHIQRLLERRNFRPEIIKIELKNFADDERFFSWGEFGHRLFFHWGFSENIESYAPLRTQIDKTLEIILKISPGAQPNIYRIKEKLYDEIKSTWKNKKDRAMDKLTKILSSKRADASISTDRVSSILSVAYCIHILGDYTDTIIAPLMSISKIREELCTHIQTFDVDDRSKSRRMNDIINDASTRRENDAINAEELLKVLKKELRTYIEHSPQIRFLLWGT